MNSIAVVGGTGRVGSHLVKYLTAEGIRPWVLTRRDLADDEQVSYVRADYSDASTLRRALSGSSRVFLAHGSSPDQVQHEKAVIDAAVAAGVRHLVKLSAMGGPANTHPWDWHAEIETHLAAAPIGFTVLRPATFTDILAVSAPLIRAGTWGGTAASGRVNLIDAADVAAVAAHELRTATDDTQRSLHLTGARPWSMPELAELFTTELARPVTYTHRSPDDQRRILLEAGLNSAAAEILLGIDTAYRHNALAETTLTVQDTLGRTPRTVAEWIRTHRSLFER
ncbi:NAD(P)H-binding protein [Nocardia brasiliensis]|uniref:NAD-dependent epimerase/dehydratase n=1 Tax=Nocardia brasiliensis (strain ATCC 700358 / HUJEG-1) TaxID=1133849 RepID=K0EWU7_NOCB7|nr:NAD(P)H-binding protein [Nocardia brasiliensis]AFU00091.1 NAD-dependent epimerase/dehydratase [Nocardia brasiliensis ATCC 700358]